MHVQTVSILNAILDAHEQPPDRKTVSSSWRHRGTEHTPPGPNYEQPTTSTSGTKRFAIGFMRQISVAGDQQSELALHRSTALLASLRFGIIWHGQGSSGPKCSLQMSHGSPCPSRFTLSFSDGRIRVWKRPGECCHDATLRELDGYGDGLGVGPWRGDASRPRQPDRHLRFANCQEFLPR